MNVAVTGSSGFVGRAVVEALLRRGLHVVALSRRSDGPLPPGAARRVFDPNAPEPNPLAFDGVDAVVHLAGEPIDGRWTAAKKQRIAESRILGTQHLVRSLAALEKPPGVLVAASAVGLYGSRGDEPLTEEAAPGAGFLASVVSGWEGAALAAERLGIRTVLLRSGIVLGNGGALAKMLPPFRAGFGGPFGTGRQFVPWIHIDDIAELIAFALEHDALRGAVNAVAPDYPTSARFAGALGNALGRPAFTPAPGFALRAALGKFAETILASQLVIPARALDAGFRWRFPELEPALQAIVAPYRPVSGVHTYHSALRVRRPLEEVFAFFADPHNLQRITPPMLQFGLIGIPGPLERGAIYDYRLQLRGFSMSWRTLIAEVEPLREFVDVQLHGPYALWRHRHQFRPVDGGVEISDTVDYALPFAPVGELAHPLVNRDIGEIFRYRETAIGSLFGERPEVTPITAGANPMV